MAEGSLWKKGCRLILQQNCTVTWQLCMYEDRKGECMYKHAPAPTPESAKGTCWGYTRYMNNYISRVTPSSKLFRFLKHYTVTNFIHHWNSVVVRLPEAFWLNKVLSSSGIHQINSMIQYPILHLRAQSDSSHCRYHETPPAHNRDRVPVLETPTTVRFFTGVYLDTQAVFTRARVRGGNRRMPGKFFCQQSGKLIR